MVAGAGGARKDSPGKPTDDALRPAEPRPAPRKEGELAKASPQAFDRLSELKRESAPAGQKPPPVGANAEAPRSPAADKSLSGRSEAMAARESATPLLSSSVSRPGGATATWRYGQGGVIERSTDRGQTWERQASGVTTALVDASAPSDSVCWVVGARGVVLRSTDGVTWQRLASPTRAGLVSVHAWSDTRATITASDRSEYETTDGGRTWARRQF
jgi:hypothetical protein